MMDVCGCVCVCVCVCCGGCMEGEQVCMACVCGAGIDVIGPRSKVAMGRVSVCYGGCMWVGVLWWVLWWVYGGEAGWTWHPNTHTHTHTHTHRTT